MDTLSKLKAMARKYDTLGREAQVAYLRGSVLPHLDRLAARGCTEGAKQSLWLDALAAARAR